MVQGAANKTIQKKNKSKKAKWLSEKALQIAEGGREAKSKGEREKYIQLNAEFQRTAKRNKKAIISEQCKEIEENNTTGKTSDLFKKIGDTKETFHTRMGTIKDRNGKDLTGPMLGQKCFCPLLYTSLNEIFLWYLSFCWRDL